MTICMRCWRADPRAVVRGTGRFSLIALVAIFVVAGCSTPPPQNRFPQLTYGHLEPIRLAVADIRIEQSYRPPLEAPHVEHLMPIAPGVAAQRWASDRLRAAGSDLVAIFTVREASVTEVALPRTKGVKGAFTTDQSERYDARLVVELAVRNARGRTIGIATAEAVRSRTVPEDLSLNERERVWFQMVEQMMQDLNGQLETTIPEALYPYLAA